MPFLRSLLFAVGMWLATLVIAPIGLLTFPLRFEHRYAVITRWARFNLWWLRLCCRLDYRVTGRELIPDRNAIVFCKHQSTWETLALQQIFPPQVWVLKRELLRIPLFGWGLAMLEPIAINRGAGRKALRQLVAEGEQRLHAGRWVVVFPEGTRVAPGTTRTYGIGGAVLASHSGYPVVPVAHNAGEYWPRKGFVKRPGTIQVEIGPPIATDGKSAEEINRAVRAWMNTTMARLSRGS